MEPPLRQFGDRHTAACHFAEDLGNAEAGDAYVPVIRPTQI
jgi:hypothetical protein